MALHFGEKLFKSPFTHFGGSVADSLYIFWFQSVACFTIICQMALLPSRLSVLWRMMRLCIQLLIKLNYAAIVVCLTVIGGAMCMLVCDWWSRAYAGLWSVELCICWCVYGGAVCMLVCDMVEPCVCWCVYGEAMCMLVCDWWSCVYAGLWSVELCVCWCVYGGAVYMLVCDWWSHVYAGVWLVELCVCWCVIGWRLWVSGCGGICTVSQSAQEASEEARPSQGNHRVRSNLAAVCLSVTH